MIDTIPAAEIPRWSPKIILSKDVVHSPEIEVLGYRAPARIKAPEIRFSPPQPMLVTGDRFTIITQADGLLTQSLYLSVDPPWEALIDDGLRRTPSPDGPVIVSANAAWYTYAHWLFQCFAAAVVANSASRDDDFSILVPPMTSLHREAFELAGIARSRIVQLGAGAFILPTQGIYTNVAYEDFFLAPHPAILAALQAIGDNVVASAKGRRIYIARHDAAKRRMENEGELCEVLDRQGFEIINMADVPLAQQIAAIRGAELIVAPHGAGLTNLVFAENGPGLTVFELMQENYINPVFLKIAQAKGLDYAALVNPMRERGDGRHGSTWAADIPALMAMLNAL